MAIRNELNIWLLQCAFLHECRVGLTVLTLAMSYTGQWSLLRLECWELLGWGPFGKVPGSLGKCLSTEVSLIRLCQCEWVLGRAESTLRHPGKDYDCGTVLLWKSQLLTKRKRPGCQGIKFFLSCCVPLISLKWVFQAMAVRIPFTAAWSQPSGGLFLLSVQGRNRYRLCA